MIIFVKFWMCIFLCIDSSESLVSKLYKFLMLSHKQHNAGSFLVEYCVSKPWRILHCCSNSLAFSYPLTGHVIFWFTTLFSRWFCEVFQTKEGPSLLRNVMLSLFLKTAIRAYLVRPQECSDRISIPPLRKKIYKDNKALEKSTTPIERGSKYFAPFPPHCEWLQDFFTSFFLPTTVWLTSRGWSCYDHRPPPPQETCGEMSWKLLINPRKNVHQKLVFVWKKNENFIFLMLFCLKSVLIKTFLIHNVYDHK